MQLFQAAARRDSRIKVILGVLVKLWGNNMGTKLGEIYPERLSPGVSSSARGRVLPMVRFVALARTFAVIITFLAIISHLPTIMTSKGYHKHKGGLRIQLSWPNRIY